jgi:chromosome segregation ATPase
MSGTPRTNAIWLGLLAAKPYLSKAVAETGEIEQELTAANKKILQLEEDLAAANKQILQRDKDLRHEREDYKSLASHHNTHCTCMEIY